MELISEHAAFGGVQRFYKHDSAEIRLPMRFAIYLPPAAKTQKVPALFFLAGLTCTEETFMIKAGAQRYAAEHGITLIAPDTSPRGANVPGETDSWDFGVGAGFYLDATTPEWKSRYRMESYITRELHPLAAREFPIDENRIGIFGHSMGGHGALTLALRHPKLFKSVSAFAPICAPSECPWGQKAFAGYLGDEKSAWLMQDATHLMRWRGIASAPYPQGMLIDQGLADKFLAEQLMPEKFEAACVDASQPLTLRRHEGYDHGYYFISTFMEDHIRFHAERL
jgi:S-formylglutathione hydrolase